MFPDKIEILAILTILFCKPINSSFVNGEKLIQSNQTNDWKPIFEPLSDIEDEAITKAFEVTTETVSSVNPSQQTSLDHVINTDIDNKQVPLDPTHYYGFSRKREPRNSEDDGFDKKNWRVRKEKTNLKSKKVKLPDSTVKLTNYTFLVNDDDMDDKKNFPRKKKTKIVKKKMMSKKPKKDKTKKSFAMNKKIKLKQKRTTNGLSNPVPEDFVKNNEKTLKVTTGTDVNSNLNTKTNIFIDLAEEKSTLNKKTIMVTRGFNTELNNNLKNVMNFANEQRLPQKLHTVDETYDFYYLNPHHIVNQLRYIAQQFSEDNITIEEEHLGKTTQYKDIMMLKVTEKNNVNNNGEDGENNHMGKPEKKIVFIVHGLSVMNIRSLPCLAVSEAFEELIGFYFDHLDDFDIFLIPMANPDGVSIQKAFWNKNKSPQKTCPGVALDRNFEISWNSRRNMSSCSQQYPGPHPFSEAETQAIRSVLRRYGHRIVAYLHLHAGSFTLRNPKGDAILYPKGYELTSMDEKYAHLKEDLKDALVLHGAEANRVTVDSLHKWHGKVAGSSVDYASSVYKVPVALELVMRHYKHHKKDGKDEALTEVWAPALEAIFVFIKRLNYTD